MKKDNISQLVWGNLQNYIYFLDGFFRQYFESNLSFINLIRVLRMHINETISSSIIDDFQHHYPDSKSIEYYRGLFRELGQYFDQSIMPLGAASDLITDRGEDRENDEDNSFRKNTLQHFIFVLSESLLKLYDLYWKTYDHLYADIRQSRRASILSSIQRLNKIYNDWINSGRTRGNKYFTNVLHVFDDNENMENMLREWIQEVRDFLNSSDMNFIRIDAMFDKEEIEDTYNEILGILNQMNFLYNNI